MPQKKKRHIEIIVILTNHKGRWRNSKRHPRRINVKRRRRRGSDSTIGKGDRSEKSRNDGSQYRWQKEGLRSFSNFLPKEGSGLLSA
jgi:hypothetical protein